MLVSLQLVGVATTPLNVTLLVPWVAPKLVPRGLQRCLLARQPGKGRDNEGEDWAEGIGREGKKENKSQPWRVARIGNSSLAAVTNAMAINT